MSAQDRPAGATPPVVSMEAAAVSIGTASATAWGYDRAGRDRHVAVSVNSDGSGDIAIYRASGTPKVTEQAKVSLRAEDFAAIRDAISAHVPAPEFADMLALVRRIVAGPSDGITKVARALLARIDEAGQRYER